mmetsp:Transcript_59932/g.154253  ORF Transcript_59932/g.154253 Transcript_59932/m.154253 type:complete len:449 (-) Transcript_59932:108-1454(-)
MAPAGSKAEATAPDAAEEARKNKVLNVISLHVFQSVCQHVITLQSEPMLVRELCGGDVAETAKLLSNTSGLVGLLGLFINQAGGKISDTTGRKMHLLAGPLSNILWGILVFNRPTHRNTVLFCRIMRMILTTFSNTVMTSAALADVFSGKELAVASSKVGAVVGVAIIATPFFETLMLQRLKHPKYTYLALSALAVGQAIFDITCFPETLDLAKRAVKGAGSNLAALNPFGFLEIYTRGSRALKGMVTVSTLQMFLEGKNMSDIVEIWKRQHLKWTIEGSRNFVVTYGILCTIAGITITPRLLATQTPKNFTSLTNFTNAVGFTMRGLAENSYIFLLAMLPMLPGVNGASASALKALSTDMATEEGMGKGEFSAWTNNLRALAGAAAPVFVGNYYAWCVRRKVYPGSVFMLAGFIGAVLPEILMRMMDDKDLKPRSKAVAPAAASTSK